MIALKHIDSNHPLREGVRFCASRAGVARKIWSTTLQRSLSDTFLRIQSKQDTHHFQEHQSSPRN